MEWTPWEVKLDPVKAEWVVIDTQDGAIIPIHHHYDFARNNELAGLICVAVNAYAQEHGLVTYPAEPNPPTALSIRTDSLGQPVPTPLDRY